MSQFTILYVLIILLALVNFINCVEIKSVKKKSDVKRTNYRPQKENESKNKRLNPLKEFSAAKNPYPKNIRIEKTGENMKYGWILPPKNLNNKTEKDDAYSSTDAQIPSNQFGNSNNNHIFNKTFNPYENETLPSSTNINTTTSGSNDMCSDDGGRQANTTSDSNETIKPVEPDSKTKEENRIEMERRERFRQKRREWIAAYEAEQNRKGYQMLAEGKVPDFSFGERTNSDADSMRLDSNLSGTEEELAELRADVDRTNERRRNLRKELSEIERKNEEEEEENDGPRMKAKTMNNIRKEKIKKPLPNAALSDESMDRMDEDDSTYQPTFSGTEDDDLWTNYEEKEFTMPNYIERCAIEERLKLERFVFL